MCDDNQQRNVGRCSVPALSAGMGVAAIFGLAARAVDAADGATTSPTPDQALETLRQGNVRYLASPQSCTADLFKRRAALATSQAPWATIAGCADSRVPLELLFGGLGLGELFVAPNAGNLVDTATLGTGQYGAAVLGAPLIVVLGHERCGAVAAACEVVLKNASFPGSIGPMIAPIPAGLVTAGKLKVVAARYVSDNGKGAFLA